jgi:hypothetical protein
MAVQSINLRGHYKIALRQAVDFVGPQRDPGFAPRQQYVRMVALLFRDRPNTIHKIQGLLEVGELKFPMKVMLSLYRPLRNLAAEFLQFRALQRRHTPAARNALFVGELFRHGLLQNFAKKLS